MFVLGTAGFVQWLPPFYFLDIIKSRMQTSLPGTYTGIAHCVQVIYKEGGSAIFFRGLTPALIRAFTLHSIIFLVYEEVSKGLSFIS